MLFSADETADMGTDDAMPVTEDYKMGDNEFTGTIHKVTIEVGKIGAGTKAEAPGPPPKPRRRRNPSPTGANAPIPTNSQPPNDP